MKFDERGLVKLSIEKLFNRIVAMDENFDYQTLYNDNRGAMFKNEYKSLMRNAIAKKMITVEKWIIAENVQDELDQLCESKGIQRSLINCLKDYHNENDHVITPFLFIVKKLDPQFALSVNDGKLNIVSEIVDVEIRPRIDGKNAMSRIFLPNEKIALASSNDNIENLVDILAVKDVRVYVVDTDTYANNIYVYKIHREDTFFKITKGFKDNIMANLIKSLRKKGI